MARAKAASRAYAAVPGSRISDADARKIGPVLESLAARGGGLGATAEAILEHARRKTSPLHSYFEWDDTKAAQEFRLTQARYLARSVKIVVIGSKGKTESKAFYHLRKDGEDAYFGAATVFTDVDLTAQLVEQAKREANAWRLKYERIRENVKLAPVFAAIDELMVEVKEAAE